MQEQMGNITSWMKTRERIKTETQSKQKKRNNKT